MKRKIFAIVLSVIMLVSLPACTSEGVKERESNTTLISIPGANDLYYDRKTKVVYIMFDRYTAHRGYGYISAYYAPNGLPYLYDVFNQELIEISSA
ncbi:hypothetical protein [Bacteroides acidifaciens]|uniref:hypothetical protein n=1 Tax=Bacteroides acidifaciens TaxID=85831 RepID=UPI00248CF8AA|nr:hypothetical protein [Bacteroides acidifaciens]